MNQVKFAEDSLYKQMKGYGMLKTGHTLSNFLRAVYHKFYFGPFLNTLPQIIYKSSLFHNFYNILKYTKTLWDYADSNLW